MFSIVGMDLSPETVSDLFLSKRESVCQACDSILCGFFALVDCLYGSIWHLDENRKDLEIVSSKTPSGLLPRHCDPILPVTTFAGRVCVEDISFCAIDLAVNSDGFRNKDLMKELGLRHMLVIRLRTGGVSFGSLCLYPKQPQSDDVVSLAAKCAALATQKILVAADYERDQLRNRISQLADEKKDLPSFVRKLPGLLNEHIKSEGIDVYWRDSAATCYTLIGTSDPPSGLSSRSYRSSDWPVCQLAVMPQYRFGGTDIEQCVKLDRHFPGGKVRACMYYPIGEIVGSKVDGFVRLVNKINPHVASTPSYFSAIDQNLLRTASDAIAMASLRYSRDSMRRVFTASVSHEVFAPLNAVKNRLEGMLEWHPLGHKTRNAVRNTQEFCYMLEAVLGQFRYVVAEEYRPEFKTTRVFRDIVNLVVSSVCPSLKDEGLSTDSVDVRQHKRIPDLYIDRRLVGLALFNVLRNAIKYRKPDSSEFRILIEDGEDDTHYLLRVLDNGVGVEEAETEDIFGFAVTGSAVRALPCPVGSGIGLYLCREYMHLNDGYARCVRHGDGVKVNGRTYVTEFRLGFAKALAGKRDVP